MSGSSTVTTYDYSTRHLIGAWYIRKHYLNAYSNKNKQFPIAIISFIVQYFFVEAFEWDSDKKFDGLTFSMNNTYVTASYNNRDCQTFPSKNIIDPKKYSSVKWEITLRNFRGNQILIGMGFLEHSLYKSVKCWSSRSWIGSYGFPVRQTSVSICFGYQQIRIYRKDEIVNLVNNEKALTKNIKIGDRLQLRFDLDAHLCSFYLNDEFMEIVTDSLSNSPLVPACCCSRYLVELQTTKWDIVYRK